MSAVLTRPTGGLGLLAGVFVILLGIVGVDLSIPVATGIVVLTIAGVSLIVPRWAEGRSLLAEHPAGVTGAAVTVLVWIAPAAGVTLTADQAVILISGATLLISFFTPLSGPDMEFIHDANLDREQVGLD